MADIPVRCPALSGVYQVGREGADRAHPGIALRERRYLTMLDLRGDPRNTRFLAQAHAALGCALPLAPNTSAAAQQCMVLWLGPDQWLVVGDRMSGMPSIGDGLLTDVSHGRTAIRIGGACARELLAKGCSLDLHASAFQPGQCAQTSVARVAMLLHLLSPGLEFDLYCARSFAAHLWHWLTKAAAEFGYEVAAATA